MPRYDFWCIGLRIDLRRAGISVANVLRRARCCGARVAQRVRRDSCVAVIAVLSLETRKTREIVPSRYVVIGAAGFRYHGRMRQPRLVVETFGSCPGISDGESPMRLACLRLILFDCE
jgi:hypothetical protein